MNRELKNYLKSLENEDCKIQKIHEDDRTVSYELTVHKMIFEMEIAKEIEKRGGHCVCLDVTDCGILRHDYQLTFYVYKPNAFKF